VLCNELILVRHGQSAGNEAADLADLERADVVPIELRDADVPLTELGREQSAALGSALLSRLPASGPPVVWSSPYLRARQTAAAAFAAAGLDLPIRIDERLRDRELGVLDRLTDRGITRLHPAEAERRRHLGRFYHRPPGGESWVDVALRLRSFLRDALADAAAASAMVFCHDVVVALIRYVLEQLTEDDLLGFAHRSVGNASLTRLVRDETTGRWTAAEFDEIEHLQAVRVEPGR
jgi:broad specificity phosphatase PhoE